MKLIPNFMFPPSIGRILIASEQIQNEPNAAQLAFMARALVQATMPHSDPGAVPIWGRTNGNLTLTIKPDWEINQKTGQPRCIGVPYGTIPRLLMFWITTEAVRTKSRRLELGDSLSSFMRELGLTPTGGRWGTIPRLREQMNRLFRAKISFNVNQKIDREVNSSWMDMQVAPKGELWWSYQKPEQPSLWKSWIELGEWFFEAICSSPVPVDMRALRALKRSPLAIDLYAWANYRAFSISQKGEEQFIPWRGLEQQMGANYTDLANFRKKVVAAMKKVLAVSPALRINYTNGGMILYPTDRHAITPKSHRSQKEKIL